MSSKRHQRRKACGDKEHHADQAGAVRHLIPLKHKGDFGLITYKCPFGNHWHVGHPPRRVRQALFAKGAW